MDLAAQFLNLATKTGEITKLLSDLPESAEQQRLVEHFQGMERDCRALIPKLPVMPEIKDEAEVEEAAAPPPPAPAAPPFKHRALTDERIHQAIRQLLESIVAGQGQPRPDDPQASSVLSWLAKDEQ